MALRIDDLAGVSAFSALSGKGLSTGGASTASSKQSNSLAGESVQLNSLNQQISDVGIQIGANQEVTATLIALQSTVERLAEKVEIINDPTSQFSLENLAGDKNQFEQLVGKLEEVASGGNFNGAQLLTVSAGIAAVLEQADKENPATWAVNTLEAMAELLKETQEAQSEANWRQGVLGGSLVHLQERREETSGTSPRLASDMAEYRKVIQKSMNAMPGLDTQIYKNVPGEVMMKLLDED